MLASISICGSALDKYDVNYLCTLLNYDWNVLGKLCSQRQEIHKLMILLMAFEHIIERMFV